MNAALAQLFPPAVVIQQEAIQVDAEARHMSLIRESAELHDVCLEELTPENVDILMELTDTIRSKLFQCKAAGVNSLEAQTG